MPVHTDISNKAFGLLADMIGGQALRLRATETNGLRRCDYVVAGDVVDGEGVHELHGAGLIVPASFADLDDVPFRVTARGHAYVRQTADA